MLVFKGIMQFMPLFFIKICIIKGEKENLLHDEKKFALLFKN